MGDGTGLETTRKQNYETEKKRKQRIILFRLLIQEKLFKLLR